MEESGLEVGLESILGCRSRFLAILFTKPSATTGHHVTIYGCGNLDDQAL